MPEGVVGGGFGGLGSAGSATCSWSLGDERSAEEARDGEPLQRLAHRLTSSWAALVVTVWH